MAFGKPKTPLTPEQQLQRRQNIGVGLAALSETLRGGDPVGRTLGLMEQFEQKNLDKQLDDAIDMSNLPESQKNLFKSLDVQTKAQALIKTFEPVKEDIPVDIRKLNELRLLRSKFDENSPNYDPTYTKEKYKQEASILGVSSTLFDPSKEKFITDYMKTISTQFKDSLGKPQYTQEEARSMAESMYESIYGIDITTPKNLDKSEDVIDLGTLNEID